MSDRNDRIIKKAFVSLSKAAHLGVKQCKNNEDLELFVTNFCAIMAVVAIKLGTILCSATGYDSESVLTVIKIKTEKIMEEMND